MHSQTLTHPDDAGTLAYCHTPGSGPGLLFCSGFNSNMEGNKARYLEGLCRDNHWQYTRFDYRGHGKSSGSFIDCHLGHWLEDTLLVLDEVCAGPQIVVGSSMGAWLAMLATQQRSTRVVGVIGLAAAPDFTERLICDGVDAATRDLLQTGGTWLRPSAYGDGTPYPITSRLIESGRKLQLLGASLSIHQPVTLLHGTGDIDVPWQLSQELLEALAYSDAELLLIRGADHRLSDHRCLEKIRLNIEQMHARLQS